MSNASNATTTTAPFAPEFQLEAIRYLLGTRKAMINYCDRIAPSFFEDTPIQQIWQLAKAHFTKYKQTPTLGVLTEVIRKSYPEKTTKHEDQRRTLGEKIQEVFGKAPSTDPYIDESLRSFIGFCAIREVFMEGADDIVKGVFNPGIVDKFRIAAQAGVGDSDLGWFAKRDAVVAIERQADPTLNPPIPTGLHLLDRELGGGLKRGELGVFMAPPKGSKSTFLLNVAHAGPTVGVKCNVLYLTLELSEEMQALRWAIKTTMVDKSGIARNPMLYQALYQRRAAAIFSPNHECVIKFHAPTACTPNKIRGILDTLKYDRGLIIDEICVDYLELMGSDNSGSNDKDYQVQTRIITDLRQVAVDYNCAIWTASRTNREASTAIKQGRWISMEHMSGSFEKIGVVDVAIAGQPYRDGMAIVPVAFRREGGNNKIACSLQPSKMSIHTLHLIKDGDKPEAEAVAEDDYPRKGQGARRKGGGESAAGRREKPKFAD